MSAVGTIGEIMVIENEDEFYFKDGNIVWFKDFNELDTNYLKLIHFTDKFAKRFPDEPDFFSLLSPIV